MKYGEDKGAGAWIVTNDGTITVSEYMLAEHKKWAERARDGNDADANMPLFVLETMKILKAFQEVLPSYRYFRRRYDEADDAAITSELFE